MWGLRAPISLRTGSHSGSVCTLNGSGDVGHADVWVGIEGNGAISQIGWTHDGTLGYCRFFEWFTSSQNNPPVFSRCGTDSDNAERLYRIFEWFNPDNHTYYYGIYDCGTTDWSSCTSLSGGAPVSAIGSSPIGAIDGESNYGGSGCVNDFMGSPTYRERFGETDDAIEGQAVNTGSFGVKSLTYHDLADCSHYGSDEHTDSTFRTYDDRNS